MRWEVEVERMVIRLKSEVEMDGKADRPRALEQERVTQQTKGFEKPSGICLCEEQVVLQEHEQMDRRTAIS